MHGPLREGLSLHLHPGRLVCFPGVEAHRPDGARAHVSPGTPLQQVPQAVVTLGTDSASLLQCPGGQASQAAQGHAWCCLPGSSGPHSMLTHRPSPWASRWFQGRATTLPGMVSSLTGNHTRTSHLSKPRPESPDSLGHHEGKRFTAESESNPRGHPHAIMGGLPGAWPHSPTLQDGAKGDVRKRQSPKCPAREGSLQGGWPGRDSSW